MPSAIEKILDLLVQEKVLTREQADDCLRTRQTAAPGEHRSMTDLVVSKGVDAERLSKTLQMARSLTLHCPKCRVRHVIKTVKLDSAYLCKRCGGPLEAEEVVPSASSPIRKLEDQTPAEVTEARQDPKRVVGKYTLLRELGRGGMAVVYQAWDSLLAQYVALKVIRDPDADLPGATTGAQSEEFLREARMAARLQHPNIVRVFEVGAHDGRHFLSMEYIDGQNLALMLKPEGKGARLPRFYGDVKKFLTHLRDVAKALEYAHRHNPPIVHRDVKPHNILVDAKGRACLVDFGLAREIRKGHDRLTMTGVTKGTPSYMAPEQARGRHGEIDARTDVWALGAVLYEYLAGRPPFEGPTEHEILNRVLHEEPRRPSDVLRSQGLVPPVLGDLEAVCSRALEKDRARRYPSAAAFAAELDRFLTGQDVEAKELSAATRALRWVSRRKAAAGAMAAAVIMGIVALVAVITGRGGERVVERVIVQKDPSARLSQKSREIERLAAAFRFDAAVQCYQELLGAVDDPIDRSFLQQRMEDLKIQQTMFAGLVDRIGKEQRDYHRFRVANESAGPVRVLDATRERLLLRRDGRLVEQPWATLDPQQFVTLVRDYWPDLDGYAALGYGIWCLRRGLTDEAALALRKQADPKAQRYLQEIAASSKGLAEGLEEPRERMLRGAEEAFKKGDFVIARARYERVLTMRSDDPDAIKGLEKVAEAEKASKKVPEPEKPAATKEAPSPKPAKAKDNSVWSPPETAAKLGPSLVPATAVRIEQYAAARDESMKTMAARDWKKSAERLRPWVPANLPIGAALDRIAAGDILDPTVGYALLTVEGWLKDDRISDDFELQRGLHLRDLLALVGYAVEEQAASDALVKDKTKVRITAGGVVRTGVLERTRGKLFLVETIAGGGTATWPVEMTIAEKAELIAQNWERQRRGPEWRLKVMQELASVYPIAAGQNPKYRPTLDNAEYMAGRSEQSKVRAEETKRLWRAKPGWKVDLLDENNRAKWQKESVVFDSRGMELRGEERATATFEGGRLEPGLKMLLQFTVETRVDDHAAMTIAFMAPGRDGKWTWREAVTFGLDNLSPTLQSYPDPPGPGKDVSMNVGSPSGSQTYVFEWSPGLVSLVVNGRTSANVDFDLPQARQLLLMVHDGKVRIDLLQVTSSAYEEPAPPKAQKVDAPDYQVSLQSAETKFIAKDFKGAIEECSHALQAKPDDARALCFRSYCRNETGDWEGALNDADKGIALKQEDTMPYLYAARAMAWWRKPKMARAELDIQQAQQLLPNEPLFRRQRAVISYCSGDRIGAVRELEKDMAVYPNHGWNYVIRGACYYDVADWQRAVADFERSLSLKSAGDDGLGLYLWLAKCRLAQRDAATQILRQQYQGKFPTTAVSAWDYKIAAFLLSDLSEKELLEEASKLAPFRRVAEAECEACFYIGSRRLMDGNLQGAAEMFKKALDTGMECLIEYWTAKAELDAMSGRRPSLGGALAKDVMVVTPAPVFKVEPSTATSYEMAMQRGGEKMQSMNYQAAVLEFSRALQYRPDDPNGLYQRSFARTAAGDPDGGAADADRGLTLPNSNQPYFYAARAVARSRKSNLKAAQADIDEAVRRATENAAFFQSIRSSILHSLGDYRGAMLAIERTMALDPNRGYTYRHRSFLYYDAGDWTSALGDQKQALRLGCGNEDGFHLYYWLTRARQGDREAATTELRSRLKTRTPTSPYMAWDFKISAFLCSDLSEDELLKAARLVNDGRRVEESLCEAYFYVGARRLLDGDTKGAESYFQKSVDTGVSAYSEYRSSRAELDAMAGKRPSLK